MTAAVRTWRGALGRAALTTVTAAAAFATPATAYDGARVAAHQETAPLVPCRTVTTAAAVAGQRLDGVELCVWNIGADTLVLIPWASPAGSEAYTPYAGATVEPLVFRVYLNGGVVEVRYPFGAASFRTPPPVCLRDNSPPPGTDCLA